MVKAIESYGRQDKVPGPRDERSGRTWWLYI